MQAGLYHQLVTSFTEVFCAFSQVTTLYCRTMLPAAITNGGFSADPLLGESKYAADLNTYVSVEEKTSLSLDLYDNFILCTCRSIGIYCKENTSEDHSHIWLSVKLGLDIVDAYILCIIGSY